VGDWRGVALSPDFPNYVYLGDQRPGYIRELDLSSGLVLRNWPVAFSNPQSSLISMTFVPGSAGEGGSFWLGTDLEDLIYVYQAPLLTNSSFIGNATLLGTFQPAPGFIRIDALSYSAHNQKIYAVTGQWLLALNQDGTIDKQYPQGATSIKGFTLSGGKSPGNAYVSCGNNCNDIFKFSWSDNKGIESGRCQFANPAPNNNPFAVNTVN